MIDLTVALGAPASSTWTTVIPIPDPEQPLREGLNPEDVSPGVSAFLAAFAMALAVILLVRSLTSKLRGVNHRAEELEEQEREQGEDGVDGVNGEGEGDDRPGDDDNDDDVVREQGGEGPAGTREV